MYQNTNESTLFKVINRGSIVDLIPLNKLEDLLYSHRPYVEEHLVEYKG